MSALATFLDMGGYAAFVWPAYGIAGLILVLLAVASRRALRAKTRLAKEMEAVRPRRTRGGEEQIK